MAKRRRGINPNDLATAQAEIEAKHGPEVATVRSLIDEARRQYEGDVTSAKSNARAVRSYATAAKPVVAQTYTEAKGSADAAADDVARAFGGLGAAADVFRAATAREQGGQRSRIAEAQANAAQSLTDRSTEATAGQAFAINNARSGYNTNLKSLSQKLTDIAGQSGSEVVARLGELRSERAERAKDKTIARTNAASRASEGAADRASRKEIADANRAAANQRAAAGRGPGGSKRATNTRIEHLSNEFAQALSVARNNTDQPRSAVGKTLITGQTPTKTTAAVPKADQFVASLALDMAYDGHVSRANARRLHELGYKVSDITGAVSWEDWKKRQPKAKAGPPASRPRTPAPFSQSAGDLIRGR